jgi:dipeptidyl aminopeptidase/acylaminoacyl peptidase
MKPLLQSHTFPITQYLQIRDAYFPSVSADNRLLAFITNITGIPQVWGLTIPDEGEAIPWPDQLTFASDRVMGAWYSPVPGDLRLIYAHDIGGNENAQLFILDTQAGVNQSLTQGHEAAMHIFGQWSRDGTRILFAANRRDPALFDLYLGDLEGQARLVWRNDQPGYLYNAAFSPDGKSAIVARKYSSFQHELFQVDLASATARNITPGDEQARFDAICYTPDGLSLYVNTDLGSDFLYIARLDLQDLRLEPLVSLDWDLSLMTLSPDGRKLAYELNLDGDSQLYLLDLESKERQQAPITDVSPGVTAFWDEHIVFSPDSRHLLFSFSGATRTSDIYAWDLEADHVRRLTRSTHAGIPLDTFTSPQLVHYPTFDKDGSGDRRMIPAWYFKPRMSEAARMPVVVVVHGGPEAQFRPYFTWFVQYLLNHGYAVLAPNVRGSTGYGKAFSHLDDVEKRMDSVADLAHAAYWLKQQPDVDPKRIAVYGGSYGGFMVLSALSTYPDLWAAGVDIVGVSSFVTFLENTSGYRRAHREAEYGSLERDRQFLESIAPINHVQQMTAPLIVIHGANDPRVPLSEAEQLVQALTQRGVPVELLVFEDEGHGIAKLKNKIVAYPAIVDFLDKHLPPG